VRQCQKCQKSSEYPFGTFGTLSVSVFGELHDLLWKRKDECPGVVQILVGVALPAQPQIPSSKYFSA
jgi:hypothetical protein